MKNDKKDNGWKKYMEGASEYVEILIDALDEMEEDQPTEKSKRNTKSTYRRDIARQALAEWKLRKKSEKPKAQNTATTPKTPSATTPKPRSNHGAHPQAPPGQEYYWYDYQLKGEGV